MNSLYCGCWARSKPSHSKMCTKSFLLTYALILDEHVVQHTCGANLLTWSANLCPKNKEYTFLNFEDNVTSVQIQLNLFGIFTQFWYIWLNILHNM